MTIGTPVLATHRRGAHTLITRMLITHTLINSSGRAPVRSACDQPRSSPRSSPQTGAAQASSANHFLANLNSPGFRIC
jgi:hypothetical protein